MGRICLKNYGYPCNWHISVKQCIRHSQGYHNCGKPVRFWAWTCEPGMTIVSTIKAKHGVGIICTGNHLERAKADSRGDIFCSNTEKKRIGRDYFIINFASETTQLSNFWYFKLPRTSSSVMFLRSEEKITHWTVLWGVMVISVPLKSFVRDYNCL